MVKTLVGFTSGDSTIAAVAQSIDTRRRRAQMLAEGMSDEAVEAVFEAEYEARRNP